MSTFFKKGTVIFICVASLLVMQIPKTCAKNIFTDENANQIPDHVEVPLDEFLATSPEMATYIPKMTKLYAKFLSAYGVDTKALIKFGREYENLTGCLFIEHGDVAFSLIQMVSMWIVNGSKEPKNLIIREIKAQSLLAAHSSPSGINLECSQFVDSADK